MHAPQRAQCTILDGRQHMCVFSVELFPAKF